MIFSLYWGAAIICLPLYFRIYNGADVRFGQDTLFMALVYLSVILFGYQENPLKRFKLIIIPMGVLSIYSFFRQYLPTSDAVLYQFFCLNAGFMLLSQFLGNSRQINKRVIYNAMAIACIIQSVWLILNSFGIDPYQIYFDICYPGRFTKLYMGEGTAVPFTGHETDIIGSIGNRTISGVMIPITLTTLTRKKWVFLLPIALYGVYLSDSSMIYLSTIVATVSYFLLKYRANLKFMFISVGLTLLVGYNLIIAYGSKFVQDSGRFEVWQNTVGWSSGLDMWIGRGLGFFGDNYNKYFQARKIFLQTHNEYLEFYIAFGIIGIILLLIIIKPLFTANKSIILVPCLLAILIDSLGSFPFHIAATSLIGIICYSLIASDQGDIHGISSNKD